MHNRHASSHGILIRFVEVYKMFGELLWVKSVGFKTLKRDMLWSLKSASITFGFRKGQTFQICNFRKFWFASTSVWKTLISSSCIQDRFDSTYKREREWEWVLRFHINISPGTRYYKLPFREITLGSDLESGAEIMTSLILLGQWPGPHSKPALRNEGFDGQSGHIYHIWLMDL